MSSINKIAVVGGGVIGGGWAARFVQNGIDVDVFDPAPDAENTISALLRDAERAFKALFPKARWMPGQMRYCASIADAVADADMVVESVPERLDIKQSVYAEIEAAASKETIITSSTSGLRPTALQAEMIHPERLIVAHPFNPVYLIPLVELVAGERSDDAVVARAADLYTALGMKPLVVRKEIDAFIADRLLEAMWREALWLVKDGVATTSEIDDAIRFGFGLRFAQMGLFETYRIAGGAAGMRHFLAQFGPTLAWPWSYLTNVPEFTDDLVETIAGQSDAQSGDRTLSDLARKRDDNLVAILAALRETGWGAGETVGEHAARLADRPSAGN